MPKKKLKEEGVAEDLFVNKLWTGAAICEFLKIQPNTFTKWKNKGNWEKLQEDTINNPVKLRRLIAQQMLIIAGGEKSALDADALAKMYKVYEGFSDKINPGIVAAIMKLYDRFLAVENPPLAISNLEWNKKFIIHMIDKHG